MDTQAIAARLTAIAARVTHREQAGNYDITLSLADARAWLTHADFASVDAALAASAPQKEQA